MTAAQSAGVAPLEGATPALSVANVSKTFPGTRALVNLNLTIVEGEIRALVGGNGSGKSTLIKILSGYHVPDAGGEIRIGGELLQEGHPRVSYRLGARFVHQDLGLVDDISVIDNLFLNTGFPTTFGTVRGKRARRIAGEVLERLGLEIDPGAFVRDLSAGQKTGLAVARALSGSDERPISLLVLDEPTAALPAAEVAVLLDVVRAVAATGVGILYVTHRLDEVFQLASRVTAMRNGQEVITTEVAGLTRNLLLEYLVGAEFLEVHRAADLIAGKKHASVFHVDGLESRDFVDVSFDVGAGEIVGVSGVTGSGRESLSSVIFGALPRLGGDVKIGDRLIPPLRPDRSIRAGVALMPADRRVHGGMMNLSATQNLTMCRIKDFWKFPSIRRSLESKEAAHWFKILSVVPSEAYELPLSSFSGGNQQKVLLGKWLRLKPKVLLLEEPTQGVDVGAKATIHFQLLQAAREGCGLLVSSSDIDELVALCDRILILRDGHLVATLSGAEVNVTSVTRETLMTMHGGGMQHVFQPMAGES